MLRHGIPRDVVTALRSVSRAFRAWGGSAQVDAPAARRRDARVRDRTLAGAAPPRPLALGHALLRRAAAMLLGGDHLIKHISSNPLISRPLGGRSGEPGGGRPRALMTYLASLRATRELPARARAPRPRRAVTDHAALIDERFGLHERRAEKISGLIAERPRTAYEIAQAMWGNVAVTQAYLTLSEVLGHVDLLLERGACARSEAGRRRALPRPSRPRSRPGARRSRGRRRRAAARRRTTRRGSPPARPARSCAGDSASTLASFQRRAPAAVAASTHSAARTPRTLLAAIDAPVPVQQQTTACSARPSATSRAAASLAHAQSSRSASASAPWRAARARGGAARSTTASATPMRSSAATAILMRPKVSSPVAEERALEQELFAVGEQLAAALPSPARHPSRRSTTRRWSSRPRTRELQGRAVPLRRRRPGLPLARRPRAPPHGLPRRGRRSRRRRSARRCGWATTAPGRAALGAAAARGRQAHGPPLHRRRDARARRSACCATCGRTASPPPSTCSARRPSPQAEAERYAARCDEALETLAEALRALARAPAPRARLARAAPARQPVGQGLGAHAAAAPRRAGARQARRRRAPARAAAPRPRARRPPAHRHGVAGLARRGPRARPRAARRARVRAGPVGGLVLQAYLRDSPADARHDRRLAAAPAPARARRSPCGWSRAPTGTTRSSRRASTAGSRRCSRSRPTATATSRRSPAGCSTPRRGCGCAGDRVAQPALGRPRDRLQPRSPAATTPTSSCRSCAASATPLQDALAAQGLRVRAYCPVGDLVAGMAYLVRRLLENTSNESFLQRAGERRAARGAARAAGAPRMKAFAQRADPRAAARADARAARRRAAALDARLPLRVPVWIGDERREGDELVSTDPGAPDRVVARRPRRRRPRSTRRSRSPPGAGRARGRATPAGAARRDAGRAPPHWLRERRLELAALEVRECAKPWPEADADVCEAIDFLEYYARGAVELAQGAAAAPGARRAQRAALRRRAASSR